MNAAIIGIISGFIVIILARVLRKNDNAVFYGLTLCGIGFLYVGFTWSQTGALVISSIQAIFFLSLAYYGIKKSMPILAAGFFLHGGWDLLYGHSSIATLAPPHYDIFCLSIDFTMGGYLLFLHYQKAKLKKTNTLKVSL